MADAIIVISGNAGIMTFLAALIVVLLIVILTSRKRVYGGLEMSPTYLHRLKILSLFAAGFVALSAICNTTFIIVATQFSAEEITSGSIRTYALLSMFNILFFGGTILLYWSVLDNVRKRHQESEN